MKHRKCRVARRVPGAGGGGEEGGAGGRMSAVMGDICCRSEVTGGVKVTKVGSTGGF